jgi:hypothetical protein
MTRDEKNQASATYFNFLCGDVIAGKLTAEEAHRCFHDFNDAIEFTMEGSDMLEHAPDTTRDVCPPTTPTGQASA